MLGRSIARGGKGNAVGLGLGQAHQLFDRSHRKAWIDQQDVGVKRQNTQRFKVFLRLVGLIGIQRGIDGVRGGIQHDGVAIR